MAKIVHFANFIIDLDEIAQVSVRNDKSINIVYKGNSTSHDLNFASREQCLEYMEHIARHLNSKDLFAK